MGFSDLQGRFLIAGVTGLRDSSREAPLRSGPRYPSDRCTAFNITIGMKVVAGIDVGGTNTDAVLVSAGRIVERIKVPTTADVRDGILAALAHVSGKHAIERIHIGTTAFTNALVERRHLEAAAAIRIGAPVSESLPPMSDWPDDLRGAVENPTAFVAACRSSVVPSAAPVAGR
jgi:hypothetical protein